MIRAISYVPHFVCSSFFFVYFVTCVTIIAGAPPKWENNKEIEIFREYLRIPTVHPNVDYKPAVEFLKKQAVELSLPVSIYYPVNNENPVVVMTWKGSQPELPSIMLNSHMDVVPVFEEYWTHLPFAAEMDANGDIFARGAQDTKAVGMQYLAAIRALKRQGIKHLKRTIHMTFVPDEEASGELGMAGFVKTDAFKQLNVGFALDEGSVANPDGTIPAIYTEKTLYRIEVNFHGKSGHGSKLLDHTPGEKLNYIIGKLYRYRAAEKRKMERRQYPEGNVTSINLTKIRGGVANNVIPAELSATFDIRVSVNGDIERFEQHVSRWCEEAGGNITIKTIARGIRQKPTAIDDSNPFWVAFKNGVAEAGFKVTPLILEAASDMRFIRNLTIPAIGFAPMINTVAKPHDHNEYLNAGVYLNGIEIYVKVIPRIANIS